MLCYRRSGARALLVGEREREREREREVTAISLREVS